MSPAARRTLAAAVLVAGALGASAAPAREAGAFSDAGSRAPRYASPRAIAEYLESRRLLRAGDVQGATEALRLAVAYDEESPELRVALAKALAEAGRVEQAEGEARRALALAADGRAAAAAHVLLAHIALARRRVEAATLALRQAIRVEIARTAGGDEPVDATAWRLLADVYLEAGDEEAAVRTLEDLARRGEGGAAGFRELGRTFVERREPARAERHLRRAIELDAGDVAALRLLASAHEALRREREARDDHLAVLRLEPEDAEALLALGQLAARAGDAERAREWFQRCARAVDEPADASARIAFAWLETDHPAEALEAARAGQDAGAADPRLRVVEGIALCALRRWREAAVALETVPATAGEYFVLARLALAEALSRGGRHAEAERALAPLDARPGDVRVVTARAAIAERDGRTAEAVALLRAALREKERAGARADAAGLATALAETLVRAGRAQEAIVTLRAALAAEPRDETLLYALGAAYDRAGQGDAAIAQMRALLALAPDHAEALNFVGFSFAERGVRLEEAERLVRRALELRPRAGHVLDSLGWVLFRRGELRRAIDALERADALAGPEPVILEHLGDVYRAAARPEDAARAYRRALTAPNEDGAADGVRRRASLERKLRELGAGAPIPPVSLTPPAGGR
jgi:tetratricopeptide (TPR) repeat protein